MRDHIKKGTVILLMLLGTVFSYGEPVVLTLSNTLELAMRNNPDLLQAEKDVRIAEAKLGQSYADLIIPSVTAGYGYSLNSGGNSSNFSQAGATSADSDSYSASLGISKTLFNGFQNWNSVKSQKESLELSKKKLEDAKRTVQYSAITNFYSLLLMEENLRNNDMVCTNLYEQSRYTETIFNRGMVTEVSNLQAKLNYKSARTKRAKALHNYEMGKAGFMNFLGLKDSDFVLSGTFTDITNIGATADPMMDMASGALSNSVDYASALNSYRTAQIAKNTEEMSRLPTVSANVNYSYINSKASLNGARSWQPSWNAGLQLSLALDGLLPMSKTRKTLDEMSENLSKLAILRDQKAESVKLQIRSLALQVEDGYSVLQDQKENLDISLKNIEQTKKNIALGNGSVLDKLSAEESYWLAIFDYDQALYDYYISLLSFIRSADVNF